MWNADDSGPYNSSAHACPHPQTHSSLSPPDLPPPEADQTKEQAVEFVNERGFICFWPVSGITLPSLWAAVAGDRPVADAHDDPGHVTWGWKDSLLGARKWYYAKVLRKKATMIALDVAPYFYVVALRWRWNYVEDSSGKAVAT